MEVWYDAIDPCDFRASFREHRVVPGVHLVRSSRHHKHRSRSVLAAQAAAVPGFAFPELFAGVEIFFLGL